MTRPDIVEWAETHLGVTLSEVQKKMLHNMANSEMLVAKRGGKSTVAVVWEAYQTAMAEQDRGEQMMVSCPFCHHLVRVIGPHDRISGHVADGSMCQGSGLERGQYDEEANR